jgi:hypothetical protein
MQRSGADAACGQRPDAGARKRAGETGGRAGEGGEALDRGQRAKRQTPLQPRLRHGGEAARPEHPDGERQAERPDQSLAARPRDRTQRDEQGDAPQRGQHALQRGDAVRVVPRAAGSARGQRRRRGDGEGADKGDRRAAHREDAEIRRRQDPRDDQRRDQGHGLSRQSSKRAPGKRAVPGHEAHRAATAVERCNWRSAAARIATNHHPS